MNSGAAGASGPQQHLDHKNAGRGTSAGDCARSPLHSRHAERCGDAEERPASLRRRSGCADRGKPRGRGRVRHHRGGQQLLALRAARREFAAVSRRGCSRPSSRMAAPARARLSDPSRGIWGSRQGDFAQNARGLAAQAQVGGYDLGNASTGQYQGQIGADIGDLSFDGVVNWTKDAVALASYSGSPPKGYDVNDVLKATLSNSAGVELRQRARGRRGEERRAGARQHRQRQGRARSREDRPRLHDLILEKWLAFTPICL